VVQSLCFASGTGLHRNDGMTGKNLTVVWNVLPYAHNAKSTRATQFIWHTICPCVFCKQAGNANPCAELDKALCFANSRGQIRMCDEHMQSDAEG
jgi:hypothetical protein